MLHCWVETVEFVVKQLSQGVYCLLAFRRVILVIRNTYMCQHWCAFRLGNDSFVTHKQSWKGPSNKKCPFEPNKWWFTLRQKSIDWHCLNMCHVFQPRPRVRKQSWRWNSEKPKLPSLSRVGFSVKCRQRRIFVICFICARRLFTEVILGCQLNLLLQCLQVSSFSPYYVALPGAIVVGISTAFRIY